MSEKKYELTFILSEKNTEDKAKELAEEVQKIVEKRGGKTEKLFSWGKKKLAYQIDDNNFGYYWIIVFSCDTEKVSKISSDLDVKDSVIRHILVDYVNNPVFWEEGSEGKPTKKEDSKKYKKEVVEDKVQKEDESENENKKEEQKETEEPEEVVEKEEIQEEENQKDKEEEKKEERRPEKSEEERREELDKRLEELLKDEEEG